MQAIADHDTKTALQMLDQAYSEGKDMGAMLDELACLTRDLMIIQTAPREGITLLSGVASEKQVAELSKRFGPGELVYMMNLIQKTQAGFTRSASRRLDAELCIVNLCQPELTLDVQSMNARISRMEQQIKNGSFTVKKVAVAEEDEEERPPAPGDEDAPPIEGAVEETPPAVRPSEAPVGFWTDLAGQLRAELKPPLSGFFATTPQAPVQGALVGDVLELRCVNAFPANMINKPEVLKLVAEKASMILGKPVKVAVVDLSVKPAGNKNLDNLVSFGLNHSGIVTVKSDN